VVAEDEDKVDWDGETVTDGPWIDRELFSLGDFAVTGKTVVYSSTTAVIIIAVIAAICTGVSWHKRKQIRNMSVKLGSSIGRLSQVIRKSTKGKGSEQSGPDFERSASEVADTKNMKNFIKDLRKD